MKARTNLELVRKFQLNKYNWRDAHFYIKVA
jgi:hypothetical protein